MRLDVASRDWAGGSIHEDGTRRATAPSSGQTPAEALRDDSHGGCVVGRQHRQPALPRESAAGISRATTPGEAAQEAGARCGAGSARRQGEDQAHHDARRGDQVQPPAFALTPPKSKRQLAEEKARAKERAAAAKVKAREDAARVKADAKAAGAKELASLQQAVIGAYISIFEESRGKKPLIRAQEGKAAKALIQAHDGDDEKRLKDISKLLRRAMMDPVRGKYASIMTIAADPGKYDGDGDENDGGRSRAGRYLQPDNGDDIRPIRSLDDL